jgi:hypothetical protein
MKYRDLYNVQTLFYMPAGYTVHGICYRDVRMAALDGVILKDDEYENFDLAIMAREDLGTIAHELVGPADGLSLRLHMLEPYGDDMEPEIKRKLQIDVFQNVAICRDTLRTFLVRVEDTHDPDVGVALTLFEMNPARRLQGKMVFEGPSDTTWPELRPKLDRKRPYHMEIGWHELQQYLLGEVGWSALRSGLQVVLHATDGLYVSTRPWTD